VGQVIIGTEYGLLWEKGILFHGRPSWEGFTTGDHFISEEGFWIKQGGDVTFV